MAEIKLTKETDVMLVLMYKEYLNKRNSGSSIRSSRHFGGCTDIQSRVCPNASIEKIDFACQELIRNSLVDGLNGDGVFQTGFLTDDAIIYMESRFSNNLDNVLQFLSKAAGLLVSFI